MGNANELFKRLCRIAGNFGEVCNLAKIAKLKIANLNLMHDAEPSNRQI